MTREDATTILSRMRPDPVRIRHAVVLASVIGLKAASRQVGASASRISEWRIDIEAKTGERFPRRHDLKGYGRAFPLSLRQCAALTERRSRGVSWGVLARIYGVSIATCRRAVGRSPA